MMSAASEPYRYSLAYWLRMARVAALKTERLSSAPGEKLRCASGPQAKASEGQRKKASATAAAAENPENPRNRLPLCPPFANPLRIKPKREFRHLENAEHNA